MADLKTKQQKDLLYYATLAGHKEVDYKEYKPSNLNDITAEDNNTKSASAAATISIYYYHPDHLGTNTLLTDMSGNAYQLFINLPFGESMAEQSSTGYYQSPYKFNGKELDKETGLYYYGTRYYDAKANVWLSVDPFSMKYPGFSPYSYCANNPILLIDPDGNKWTPWQTEKGSFRTSDERKVIVGAHNSLYARNSTYKQVYNQLEKSKETYSVVQKNIDGNYWISGNYNKDTKTVEPYRELSSNTAYSTMFEEVFHAGQDDYYSNIKQGSHQTGLEREIEAKFAAVVMGIGDDEYGIQKLCPTIFKSLKEGNSVTQKDIAKDWNGVKQVSEAVAERYKRYVTGKERELRSSNFLSYSNYLNQLKKSNTDDK